MGTELNSWRDVREKFKLLASEQRGMPENEKLCVYRDPTPPIGDGVPVPFFFGTPKMWRWTISNGPDRLFQKKFKALAARAGAKLGPACGSPFGPRPPVFWLDCLYDYLLENVSPLLLPAGPTRETIKSVCEASVAYCSWLETKALEAAASAERRDAKRGKLGASQAGATNNPQNTRNPKRLSATVNSSIAVKRMEAYLESKCIGLTTFARQANTTDRTLRKFRKTCNVRRDIFEGIAEAMGTTKDALLKPE